MKMQKIITAGGIEPGTSTRWTETLTTRAIFASLWRVITRKRVRLGKNEYQIRNQRKKLPLSTKFHVKTPKSPRDVPKTVELTQN